MRNKICQEILILSFPDSVGIDKNIFDLNSPAIQKSQSRFFPVTQIILNIPGTHPGIITGGIA